MAQKSKKLTDKDFWTILRKNGGLFAHTARAIEQQFNMSYTRQAVRARALTRPDLLADIEEQNADNAEATVYDLMDTADERVRADLAKFYLQTKAKDRGYVKQIDTKNLDAPNASDIADEIISRLMNHGWKEEEAKQFALTEYAGSVVN